MLLRYLQFLFLIVGYMPLVRRYKFKFTAAIEARFEGFDWLPPTWLFPIEQEC